MIPSHINTNEMQLFYSLLFGVYNSK